MTYDIGDLILLSCSFTDIAGIPTDPTAVQCTIKLPNGSTQFLVLQKADSGSYFTEFAPTISGLYYYRFAGIGAVTAAEEGTFFVRKKETA
jgi:hypothetical protein